MLADIDHLLVRREKYYSEFHVFGATASGLFCNSQDVINRKAPKNYWLAPCKSILFCTSMRALAAGNRTTGCAGLRNVAETIQAVLFNGDEATIWTVTAKEPML
jgi:hypothetical protein